MPNTICDLHLHSYYSDGRASPGEIVRHAASIGLKTLAITDHDNVRGVPEASFVASELGLDLIPAVEFTATWKECSQPGPEGEAGTEIEILGYFIDAEDEELLAFSHRAMNDLADRVRQCVAYLTQAGYRLSLHDVLAENPRFVGGTQIISALERKGYAKSWRSALGLFDAQWRRVRPCGQEAGEVIETIHKAGGAAVLSHPVSIHCSEGLVREEELSQLVDLGLDGLEVYHPRMNTEARRYFLEMAKHFNLAVSGGSGEHGFRDRFSRMGSEPFNYSLIAGLRARSRAAG